MRRCAFLLPMVAAMAGGFQNADKDTYDIYSLLFTNAQTSHGPDNNPVYLIAETTVDEIPPVPCVDPPPDRKAKFGEVLADFGARKGGHTRLAGELRITKPYRYVTAAEARDPAIRRLATDLFGVGNVYFDSGRTLALTYLSSDCGGLCGKFTWRVFERNGDGKWEERRWVNCSTMA